MISKYKKKILVQLFLKITNNSKEKLLHFSYGPAQQIPKILGAKVTAFYNTFSKIIKKKFKPN